MAEGQYWVTTIKDVTTNIALLTGGGWAIWKWGYSERLRERREMCSPDGTLSAIAVHLDNEKSIVTVSKA